jgi:hypothetical protein
MLAVRHLSPTGRFALSTDVQALSTVPDHRPFRTPPLGGLRCCVPPSTNVSSTLPARAAQAGVTHLIRLCVLDDDCRAECRLALTYLRNRRAASMPMFWSESGQSSTRGQRLIRHSSIDVEKSGFPLEWDFRRFETAQQVGGQMDFPNHPGRVIRPIGRNQFGKWVATIFIRLSGPFFASGIGDSQCVALVGLRVKSKIGVPDCFQDAELSGLAVELPSGRFIMTVTPWCAPDRLPFRVVRKFCRDEVTASPVRFHVKIHSGYGHAAWASQETSFLMDIC